MEDAPAAESVVEGDVIERVLWHQPLGRSEQQRAAGASDFPSEMEWGEVMRGGGGVEWEEQEIYIKWLGRSYLHCEWLPLATLGTVSQSLGHATLEGNRPDRTAGRSADLTGESLAGAVSY